MNIAKSTLGNAHFIDKFGDAFKQVAPNARLASIFISPDLKDKIDYNSTNDDVLRAHVSPDKQAPDPRSFAEGLSVGFCRLLAKMVAKDLDSRYQTWEEVLADATAVEAGGDLEPPPAAMVS